MIGGNLGGLKYDVDSADYGYLSSFVFKTPAAAAVSSVGTTLHRAFPTASDRRIFPIYTQRVFPVD